jgi:methyl-accepting chemotaxis protein
MTTRRISIGTKLYAAFGVSVALMTVLGLLAINGLGSVHDRGRSMYADQTLPIEHLGTVGANLANAQRLVLRGILKAGDPAIQKSVDASIAQLDHGADRAIAEVADSAQTPAAKQHLQEFQTNLAAYRAQRAQVRSLSRAGRKPAAAAANDKTLVLYEQAEGDLNAVTQIDAAQAESEASAMTSTYDSARLLILALLAIAILVAAASSYLVTRGVRRGVGAVVATLSSLQQHCLGSLSVALHAMAGGDLTRTVTPVTPPIERLSSDEIGDAGRAANEIRSSTIAAIESYGAMRVQLVELVGRVSESSATVSSASQQMASTSEEAGRAVGEIAHAVGEVATGAERQVRMVGEARDAAETGARSADRARDLAGDGKRAASQASEAMASVRDASLSLSEAIQALGAKSERIGGIVETITGIAGQTNLLALNAAIEAARAGEQGKGFAVVADEVRKLAEESEQAAESIAALVNEIQADTSRAVSVVQDGARRTEDGVVTVEQAREVFEKIDTAVEEFTARIAGIATSTSEVAAVAEQSAASAEEVSASTEESSAAAQEIAASARELAHTAQELQSLISQFQTA